MKYFYIPFYFFVIKIIENPSAHKHNTREKRQKKQSRKNSNKVSRFFLLIWIKNKNKWQKIYQIEIETAEVFLVLCFPHFYCRCCCYFSIYLTFFKGKLKLSFLENFYCVQKSILMSSAFHDFGLRLRGFVCIWENLRYDNGKISFLSKRCVSRIWLFHRLNLNHLLHFEFKLAPEKFENLNFTNQRSK